MLLKVTTYLVYGGEDSLLVKLMLASEPTRIAPGHSWNLYCAYMVARS
jgi:hypothetical protein